MQEFSKTLRFDFPRIPVVGSLLLTLLLLNFRDHYSLISDEHFRPAVTTILSLVIGLGIAGITAIQLLSIALSDLLSPLMVRLGLASSCKWFRRLQDDRIHLEREHAPFSTTAVEVKRERDIKDLNHQQINATLHALEMECRQQSPSFGVQLEYYYSLYVFFASLSLTASALLLAQLTNHFVGLGFSASSHALYLNIGMASLSTLGAVRARRMKEYLRITLFDHNRKLVLNALGAWYQCAFPNQREGKEPKPS